MRLLFLILRVPVPGSGAGEIKLRNEFARWAWMIWWPSSASLALAKSVLACSSSVLNPDCRNSRPISKSGWASPSSIKTIWSACLFCHDLFWLYQFARCWLLGQAFGRMKQLVAIAGEDNYTSWSLLGVNLCRRAWMTIHCMGHFGVKYDGWILWFFSCQAVKSASFPPIEELVALASFGLQPGMINLPRLWTLDTWRVKLAVLGSMRTPASEVTFVASWSTCMKVWQKHCPTSGMSWGQSLQLPWRSVPTTPMPLSWTTLQSRFLQRWCQSRRNPGRTNGKSWSTRTALGRNNVGCHQAQWRNTLTSMPCSHHLASLAAFHPSGEKLGLNSPAIFNFQATCFHVVCHHPK